MYYIHPICCRQQWKKNNDICQSWTSEDWSVIRVSTPLEISFILSFCGLSLGARHFRFACLNIFHIFFSNNVILLNLQSCHCLSLKDLNLFKYCRYRHGMCFRVSSVFVLSILFWFPQCTHYFWRVFWFLFMEHK